MKRNSGAKRSLDRLTAQGNPEDLVETKGATFFWGGTKPEALASFFPNQLGRPAMRVITKTNFWSVRSLGRLSRLKPCAAAFPNKLFLQICDFIGKKRALVHLSHKILCAIEIRGTYLQHISSGLSKDKHATQAPSVLETRETVHRTSLFERTPR